MIYTREECEFKIEFDDEKGIYTVYDGEGSVVKESNIKYDIDEFICKYKASGEKTYRKKIQIRVFWIEGLDGESQKKYGRATALTIPSEEWGDSVYCWVKDAYGLTSKKHIDRVFLRTSENNKIFSRIQEIRKQINGLNKQIEDLSKSMKTVTRDMFSSDDAIP